MGLNAVQYWNTLYQIVFTLPSALLPLNQQPPHRDGGWVRKLSLLPRAALILSLSESMPTPLIQWHNYKKGTLLPPALANYVRGRGRQIICSHRRSQPCGRPLHESYSV